MFNFPSNGGLPGFRVGRPDDVPGFNIIKTAPRAASPRAGQCS